jgi:hypothetical protein
MTEHETPEEDVGQAMRDCAESAVAIARESFATELDFSEDSVREVERILEIMRKDVPKNRLSKLLRLGPSNEQIWNVAFAWGGYVGEVIRRHWGGEWTTESALSPKPTVTLRVGGTEVWPPARVYKRLTLGPEDNVWHYYCSLREGFKDKGQQPELSA